MLSFDCVRKRRLLARAAQFRAEASLLTIAVSNLLLSLDVSRDDIQPLQNEATRLREQAARLLEEVKKIKC